MKKLTEVEMAKRDAIKIARAAIRLKHTLAADHEMNEQLPDLEQRIDDALLSGNTLSVDAGDVFNGYVTD